MINNLILKEGQKTVFYLLALTLFSALFICSFLTTLLAIITIFIIYIYRIPSSKLLHVSDILSPTDGMVTAMDKQDGKNIVYVKLGLCDTHVLRAPISSKLEIIQRRGGVNLPSETFKSKQLNSKTIVAFGDILITLLSGKYNFQTSINEQKELQQNEKFGVMVEGEVQISLPQNMPSKVKLGQKVYAGQTVLA